MAEHRFVSEDDKTFTIEHPTGEHFSVIKDQLDPSMLDQIQKMPRLMGQSLPSAQSVDVNLDPNQELPKNLLNQPEFGQEYAPKEDQFTLMNTSLFPQLTQENQNDPFTLNGNTNVAQNRDIQPEPTPSPAPNVPLVPEPEPIPQPSASPVPQPTPTAVGAATPQNPYGISDANNLLAEGYKNQIAGYTQKAAAETQQANLQKQAYDNFIKDQAKQKKYYDDTRKRYFTENDKITQEVMNGNIDPNRLWHNMSTGNKVLAGISLLLGGIGSGMTGQPSEALKIIQGAMDRDMEAQKGNMNKKLSLLRLNMDKFHSLDEAQMATRLELNAYLQAMIGRAAAQTGSQMAQANAKMAIGQLQQSAWPTYLKLQMMQVTNQLYGQNKKEGGLPIGSYSMQLMNEHVPDYSEKIVSINGRDYQAKSKADAGDLNTAEAQAGPILSLLRELDQISPLAAVVPGTEANQRAEAIRAKLSVAIPMFNGSIGGVKRISDTESHAAMDQVRNPSKFFQLIRGGIRNDVFFRTLEDEMESNRQQKLHGYKGMGQFKTLSKPIGRVK